MIALLSFLPVESRAQYISDAKLVKEVSANYMGDVDTLFDYTCELTVNWSLTIPLPDSLGGVLIVAGDTVLISDDELYCARVSLQSDSLTLSGRYVDYLVSDLEQLNSDSLLYELPLGPVEISHCEKVHIKLLNPSEAIIDEFEIEVQ